MATAMEALLTAPTDTIVACPSISVPDARLVTANLHVLLNKCLYCVRLKLPCPLEVLLTVVAEAGELLPDKVCAALLEAADEGTGADLFSDLASQLLSRRTAALRLQFDVEVFFRVVQLFSCAAPLKDRLGARLCEVLLAFMVEVDLHADDYRVPRHACSALISLLRGSPANKNRLGPRCAAIAGCLDVSSDFFFQMQCVEVLYRLYKHRNSFLTNNSSSSSGAGGGVAASAAAAARASPSTSMSSAAAAKPATDGAIHPFLLRGIEELPNDSTLLLSIHQLLDSYNRDVHPDSIISFAALRLEVAAAVVSGGIELARATTLYFSRLLLVVLLSGHGSGSGHNSASGSGGSTGGYLTIPYEHVRSVKLTKEHKLELRLYTIPSKLAHVMRLGEEGMDKLHVSLTRATMQELRTSVVHTWVAERKRTAPRRVLSAIPAPPALSQLEDSDALEREDSATRGPSRRSYAASTMAERPVNTLERSATDGNTRPSSLARGKLGLTLQPPQQQHQSGEAYAVALGNSEDEGAEAEHTYLSEVHRAASVKAARYREEQHASLQEAVDAVRSEVEELHRWSARERDAYETRCREDMQVVRRSEAVLKESATDCVRALNAELEDVQALGALLKGEVDKLRERLAKSLGKSEGVEEAFLSRIKQMVDARMRGMEATLLAADAAGSAGALSGPSTLGDVSQYITQKLHAVSSGGSYGGAGTGAAGGGRATTQRRGVSTGGGASAGALREQQPLKERRLDYT